jgi:hypothetical protein
MAQKTYTPEVEAYLDAELAEARRTVQAAERSTGDWVAEGGARPLLGELRYSIASVVDDNRAVILVALLPAVVLAAQYALPLLPLPASVIDGW